MRKNVVLLLVGICGSLAYAIYAFKKGGRWAGLVFVFIWVLVFLYARKRYAK